MGKETQEKLIWWISEKSEHEGLSASEIVDVSGIYEGHGRYDRCMADLKQLEKKGLAERSEGRPARWTPTADALFDDDRSVYMVIGVYADSYQRYADTYSAVSAEHAEEQAQAFAEDQGAELIVAGTIEYEAGSIEDLPAVH